MKELNVKLLLCHHKKSPYVKNECILPIQVGKANKDFELEYCVGDDTGDNISEKNPSWCELTALYWAWKNLDADYYGLMHYRRFLSFEDNEDYRVVTKLDEGDITKSLSPENIRRLCQSADIITGPIWGIHPVGLEHKRMSSYEFYAKEHIKADMDITLKVIKEKFPEYYYASLDEMSSNECFFMNLMVLKKELFYEYCEFLLGVLTEVEKQIDITDRDSYQKRVFGFIAERLSNMFVIYCRQRDPKIRIKHTGIYFLADANKIDAKKLTEQVINKETIGQIINGQDESVNVCMSFDDNYLAPGLTTLISLLIHTNAKVNIYLLCDDRLSDKSRQLIKLNMGNNGHVEFIDVNAQSLSGLPLNREYISINTYYRLLIHELIDVDKIIYMDSDVIVADDILNLWHEDITGYCIAGALDEGGIMQSRRLSLGADSNYINAGILVFNLKEIKTKYADPLRLYLETYYFNRDLISLQDQDILNIAFKDEIKVLPLKWNVNGRIFEVNELDFKYSKADIERSLDDLGIIHYTDRKKPWKFQATHPLKSLYWHYRDKVKGLPLSSSEKRSLFMQSQFKYQKEGSQLHVDIHGFEFKINKDRVKKGLQILKFKF
ncbi:DUF4422 domain-containing protein [Veillonella seminalis]|jgi:lipopolysaccharide biosynthesis glycosyltransferase|uniref:DUF4422 domain-containing protein n=1 Tax=Veillonella seminalis TaxID=1502943 RepID=UPI0023F7B29B|nr:DUF4422 domain-containing protein [Veillonella seminalis]